MPCAYMTAELSVFCEAFHHKSHAQLRLCTLPPCKVNASLKPHLTFLNSPLTVAVAAPLLESRFYRLRWRKCGRVCATKCGLDLCTPH
eukprot:6180213-Pleurochrysis_carterae.AAC.8